jgi:hypothetical protein
MIHLNTVDPWSCQWGSLYFNGADSFTFRVNDGTVESGLATADIAVNAVNDAPVAQAQSVSTE